MQLLRAYYDRFPPLVRNWIVHAKRETAFAPIRFVQYLRDRRRYRTLPGAEPLRWRDALPAIHDRTPGTPFDSHYLYQDTWAAQKIAELAPDRHVDVGSRVDFVCFLTALTLVTFVDIRPLGADVDGLQSLRGSVLRLPFPDQSIVSLSCLHVAEHVGLGRYGDDLDPLGTRKAIAELQRVLAPGGQLLFSLPVGASRVCFNAHRIHDPGEIVSLFHELELLEFAGVDDQGRFHRGITPPDLAEASYACGMYRLARAGYSASGQGRLSEMASDGRRRAGVIGSGGSPGGRP